VKHWLGIEKEYPEIGFHHPMEKFLLISFAIGIILLGISGIPLAFYFNELSKEIIANLLLIHDIGFILVIVPLAGHFMLAINSVNWPVKSDVHRWKSSC